MSKHILILAGDGIGPEIVKAAEQVLTRVNDQFNLGLTWEQGLLGGAAIDAHGSPYPDVTRPQSKIEIEFYKVEWKWWWDQAANSETSYNEKFYQEEVLKESITLKDGQGSWKFNVKYPAWGRYMVRACDEGGHCTGQVIYIDWPGWAGRAQKDNPGGATMLTFSADKDKYKVGDNVTLTIPAGKSGRALVSLESGA